MVVLSVRNRRIAMIKFIDYVFIKMYGDQLSDCGKFELFMLRLHIIMCLSLVPLTIFAFWY